MTSQAPDETELLSRYGIVKVTSFRYHYGQWRYSSLAEAVAQARRDAVK